MPERRRAQALRGKRIGFMLASIHTGSSLQMWPPVVQLARQRGIDLFILPGGRLRAEDPQEAIRNGVFSLATPANLDGVVSWASSLGGFVGTDEVNAVHAGLAGIPVVSMAHRLPGRPVVAIDAYAGMFPILRHLHREHGARRIAYIRGPGGHESADDRWRAYQDFHFQEGITLDPDLVSSPLAWNSGRAGLDELLDKRGLMPGRDFDALMAASDYQLYDAVVSLQARGFAIPDDVMVAGFNDSPESRILSPTLTTVRMPFAEQSTKAFAALLGLLAGEGAEETYTLGTRLVVRRSCGCGSALVAAAGGGETAAPPPPDAGAFRTALVEEVCAAFEATEEERSAWIEVLVDDYLLAVQPGETRGGHFLKTLGRVAERFSRGDGDMEALQDIVSALRSSAGRFAEAEALLDKARVSLAEASERAHAFRVWKMSKIAQAIRDLEKDLIRVSDRGELGAVLAARLPALEIGAAYVIEEPEPGRAELIAGFGPGGPLDGGDLGPFPGTEILPPRLLADQRGQSWVVEPLSGAGETYGRLVVRVGVADGAIYEELRGALSSALQGLRTRDALRRAREEAEKAEALKTRFLANVSVELRTPLRAIIGAADRIEAALSRGGREGGRGPRILQDLGAIRQDARRQLRLTDDLLDLSLSEVQELTLDTRMLRPESILASAREEAGLPAAPIPEGPRLPLIQADRGRLVRILTALMEASGAAEAVCEREGACAVFRIRAPGGEAPGGEDPFGRVSALARRLAAAHFGRLEEAREGEARSGWNLRIPFPSLGGGPSAQSPDRTAALSPAELRLLAPDYALPEDVGAIEWRCAGPAAAEASGILELARKDHLARLPFLIDWTGPDGYPEESKSLPDFVSRLAGSPVRGSILVCGGTDGRRAEVLELLEGAALGKLQAVAGPEDLGKLRTIGHAMEGTTLILLLGEGGWIPALRGGNLDRPPLVWLCGREDASAPMGPYLEYPRTVVLNEGVLSPPELTELLGALAGGRAILPPYTGAIVKNAIGYLNRHLADPVSRWQLAEAANVSEDYLTRVFRKELGISPWEYLSRLRLEEARRLLRESADSIGSVAERCGFQDQAYFCRVFRKTVGTAPSAYREAWNR